MDKLIIYELNELPQKLLKDYISLKPKSTIAEIYTSGLLKTTETYDSGELHPWSTWPTFYRGVNNDTHNIRFINQDKSIADTIYPNVWELLAKNGIKIGIFGSLQSHPPLITDNVDFYLPDTFAPDSRALPEILSTFQDFNLSIVVNNNAISRGIRVSDILNFSKCIKENLISPITLFKIFLHLSKEIILPKYKLRRSLMQPVLGFDPYFNQLNKYKPSFSTFFTNHLAGMLHRYWYDFYPEDFENKPRKKSIFKKDSILKALDIADIQIKKLLFFSKKYNYNLWIASSMGQGAINRGKYKKEIYLKNPNQLINTFKLNKKDYDFMPSMYPDINLKCNNEESLKIILRKINHLVDYKNNPLLKLRYRPTSFKINLIIDNNCKLNQNNFLLFNDEKISLDEIGFESFERDIGTGYHIPEGILLSYGNKSFNLLKKYSKIDTTSMAPLILKFFNLEKEHYMKST